MIQLLKKKKLPSKDPFYVENYAQKAFHQTSKVCIQLLHNAFLAPKARQIHDSAFKKEFLL